MSPSALSASLLLLALTGAPPPSDPASQALEILRAAGIATDDAKVVTIESVDWPDAALGCPQPEQMVIQIITPGHRVGVLAAGAAHAVHLGPSSEPARPNGIVCDRPLPMLETLPAADRADALAAVADAIDQVAARWRMPAHAATARVHVVSVSAQDDDGATFTIVLADGPAASSERMAFCGRAGAIAPCDG
ncbi:MAG: hypothetical protein AAF772_18165 [Acidobacteriota bacterium]